MKRFGSLVLVLGLAVAPAASFADCEVSAGEQGCAEAAADQAEQPAGYTWEELVEQIPGLKEYELGFQRSTEKGASKDDGTYMLCRKVQANNSRIRKRVCMPLDEALAYASKQRTDAEQRRLELLSLQSMPPVQRLARVPPRF